MAQYIFLDDGRRVDVTDGRVTVFPDDGFSFRKAVHVGEIDRRPGGWKVTRNGEDLGFERSRKEAVARLADDAAEEISAREQAEQQELAQHAEAVDLVRRFLPDYRSTTTFGPFLVFAADDLLELLEAVDEHGLHDDVETDQEPEIDLPVPTLEQAIELVREHLGVSLASDPEAVAGLAAIGITNSAWRNTYLEDLHASNHTSGGFPDTAMMRFNIATFRAVAEHVTAERVDWAALHGLLIDADRPLPGGTTVGQLAGDELPQLFDSFAGALWSLQQIELHRGFEYGLLRVALIGGSSCRDWFGTPWWPDVVDAFVESLADPSSAAWAFDDGSRAAPASVVDRDALRALLLDRPEDLDDEGQRWCRSHGLAFDAPSLGYARWRRRREPSWADPNSRPADA